MDMTKNFICGIDVMETLLKDNKFEYLYKIKSPFAREFYSRYIDDDLMTAIKICNRHNIEINDTYSFRDTIKLMKDARLDIRNPKLLADWKQQHDKAQEKIRKHFAKLEMIKKIDERKSLLEDILTERQFQELHKDHINIEFSKGGMVFRTLNSVIEYFDEGEAMHHCVYRCNYHKQKETVIFSIRNEITNERLATLEYNIEKDKVMQCRSYCNAKPERYDDMVRYFNENIHKYFNNYKLIAA